jgi:hypothetical protein
LVSFTDSSTMAAMRFCIAVNIAGPAARAELAAF